MKNISILFIIALLAVTARAGLPTPEEEIAALKAEYARRETVAVRPVKDWFALELAKKEKAFLAAGKSDAAATVAQARSSMLLCSASWSWERKGYKNESMVFRPDGTGTHTLTLFKWKSLSASEIQLELPGGKTCKLKLSVADLTMSGTDFDGRTWVVSRAIQ